MEKTKLKELIEHQIKNNPQLSLKPIFLHCSVRWDEEDDIYTENYDTPSVGYENVVIACVDEDDYNTNDYGSKYWFDDKVLYYIFDINELLELIDYENGREFHLIDYFYSSKEI